MSATSNRIQTVTALVEKFLQERITAESVLSQWPDIVSESNSLIKELWHRLAHFVDDTDIRNKEPSYDKSQRKHIESLLDELRRGKV